MKRILSAILLLAMSLSMLAGCDGDGSTASSAASSSVASSASVAASSGETTSNEETTSRLTASELNELITQGGSETDIAEFSIPEGDYIIPPTTAKENLYYYYHNLPASLSDAYSRLTVAIANCEMTCQLDFAPTAAELDVLYTCIILDNPQFFHVYSYEQDNHFAFSPDDPSLIYIMYDIQVSTENPSPDIEKIKETYAQIKEVISEPITEAKKYKSVFDQTAYIYYWLVDNTQISWSEHNERPHSTIKELIIDKHGVCIGYALTLSFLYRELGIPTTIGTGINSSNVEHTWCIPYIDGKYYACDAYFGNEHRVNFEHSSAEYLLMESYQTEIDMMVTPYSTYPGPQLG